MINKNELTKEMIERAVHCKDAEELMELAKTGSYEMTKEEAEVESGIVYCQCGTFCAGSHNACAGKRGWRIGRSVEQTCGTGAESFWPDC